jgi:hypothetical protein
MQGYVFEDEKGVQLKLRMLVDFPSSYFIVEEGKMVTEPTAVMSCESSAIRTPCTSSTGSDSHRRGRTW